MSVYILSGLRDSVLSCVEVFNSFSEAQNKAKELAKKWNVPQQFVMSNRHDKMDGWVIVDVGDGGLHLYSEAIFIAITQRTIYQDTHASIAKQIFDTPPSSPTIKDNPLEDSLPGGFDWNDKALFIRDIRAHSIDVKDIYNLTEEQKWALIYSRVLKRPNFLIRPKAGLYSQKYALEELKERSSTGLEIRNLQLNELQSFYDSLKEDSWSDDESSSEDSYEE